MTKVEMLKIIIYKELLIKELFLNLWRNGNWGVYMRKMRTNILILKILYENNS